MVEQSFKSPNIDSDKFTSGHSEGFCFSCFKARDATLVINFHLGPSQNIVRKSAWGLVWWNKKKFQIGSLYSRLLNKLNTVSNIVTVLASELKEFSNNCVP